MYFSYFEGFNEHSTNKKPICWKRRVPQSSERNNGLEAIKPIQLQSEPWLQLLLLHTDNLRSETVRLILLHLSSDGAASTAATITLLLHLWHGARHELIDAEAFAGHLRRQDGLRGTHELTAGDTKLIST